MTPGKDDTPGRSSSPGNEGSRGSAGVANRGAQPRDATNEGGDASLPDEGKEDLRDDANAQGGGGIGSNSSRSRNQP